jgi:hypothetical protein
MRPSYAAKNKGTGVSGGSQAMAQKMLTASVAFLEALSTILFSFYSELTNADTKTSGTEVWSLVCSINRRMLADKVATEYLWTALQAHRIMAEYTTHEFQHYPSIATIINYHLYRDRCSTRSRRKSV